MKGIILSNILHMVTLSVFYPHSRDSIIAYYIQIQLFIVSGDYLYTISFYKMLPNTKIQILNVYAKYGVCTEVKN